jgi:hypothetical protein
MASRAYRGPNDRQLKTISNKTVGAALLPCTFVTEAETALAQATAFGPNLRLLLDREYYSTDYFDSTNPLLTAYASGDTGIAAVLEPGQTYQVAVAAATYTWGQEITVAAAGRGAGAASTNVVVGFARGSGAKSAGDLMDVEICMPYVKA